MEIERKFLVETVPENLEKYKYNKIVQGYISTSPVIRIRQYGFEYVLTIKGKGSTVREEFEINIDKKQFDNLLPKVESKLIVKDRYYIPLEEGLTAELDLYHDFLEGLLTVEVEFDNVENCKKFIPPSWFGADVSNDYRYRNSNLSKGDFDKLES